MSRKNLPHMLKFLLSILVPGLLVLLRPFAMTGVQSLVLGALVLAIIWWVTGLVERTLVSILLLCLFAAFSGVSAKIVFSFPLSENFLMIVFSFLFSQGISNSGLADKLLQPLLARYARSYPKLLLSMFLCALVLIFVIPQPFSRIIILSLIYANFFDRAGLSPRLKSVLLLGLFSFSVFVNMMFIRGDIILNGALLTLGGFPTMGEGTWVTYMAVPTAIFCLLAAFLYIFLFQSTLLEYTIDSSLSEGTRAPLSKREKLHLAVILCVVVFWALEDLHGIPGTWIVIGGTVLLFCLGLLKARDLSSVNVKLLVFLTAAFSIGGVMKASGVADILFSRFSALFPATFSPLYVLVTLVTAIALHMILGSNITTMSVVVPGLMAVSAGIVAPEIMLFLVYIAVCAHFILPFHQVIILLGEGKGYYSGRQLLRFGIPLTALVVVSVFALYLTWWNLMGLL